MMKVIIYPWVIILLISTLIIVACSFQQKKNQMIFEPNSHGNSFVLPVQLNNHFWN